MTTKTPVATTAAKQELVARIASAQKQADTAKRVVKLAKLGLRQAKKKCKEAKRAAKKLRKAVKALAAELATLNAVKRVRKAAARKPTKRSRPVAVLAQVVTTEPAPMPTDAAPPAAPPQ
jgi:chromosome segregation ATPase